MNVYRTNGAAGALMDEYEKALIELKVLINKVSPEELITLVDTETKDEDCKSIQTILAHVIRAGYNYTNEIRKSLGESPEISSTIILSSVQEYQRSLDDMFAYNLELFNDYPHLKLEEKDPLEKMVVAWGQTYDAEQLLEHAIVHILRHRRQIERFLEKLRA